MSVFISYNSQSRDLAELIQLKLESKNILVWKDTNNIEIGTEWRNEIDQGILNCEVVIVLLNPLSTTSSYVTYEWAFGLGSGKVIIPVLVETCDIHPRITTIQYLDFRDHKRPFDKLIERIQKVQNQKTTLKVSDLTVEQLENLLSGSRQLATVEAKSNGRELLEDDIAKVANKIVNAKSLLDSQPVKSNTILWIDDLPQNNIFERQAMELIGFTFELALTTQEALTKLKSSKYIAVISDMSRPEGPKEGYILLKELRKFNKNIPFFIYSSSNSIKHKIEAQENGAQGSTNVATELIDLITFHVKPEDAT